MIRYVILTFVRVVIIYAVVYGLYRLVKSVASAFWGGLKGEGGGTVKGGSAKKIEYKDVQDATFEEVRKKEESSKESEIHAMKNE